MSSDLQQIEIFKGLSKSAFERLLSASRVIEKLAGETLFLEQDANTPVCFLVRGGVRIFRTNTEGKEQNLTIINEGEVFNLPTAFFAQGLAPASASAVCKSRIVIITQQDFRQVVTSDTEISMAVLCDLSAKLEHLTSLVQDLSLKDVRGRLAKFLLEQNNNPNPAMRWTHEKIASQIGTSREVISRLLQVFVKEGLIEINRHQINTKKVAALTKISEQ